MYEWVKEPPAVNRARHRDHFLEKFIPNRHPDLRLNLLRAFGVDGLLAAAPMLITKQFDFECL
jgi:hypothetical protein